MKRFEDWNMPEPMSGCFLWLGRPDGEEANRQYGRFWMDGKLWSAHRAAWQLYRGDIPGGLQVLHRCDNPACVNPNHLFLGTNDDNAQDKARKGRGRGGSAPGETHPMRKLNDDAVREIRARHAAGARVGLMAREYGVAHSAISNIVRRKTWGHVE